MGIEQSYRSLASGAVPSLLGADCVHGHEVGGQYSLLRALTDLRTVFISYFYYSDAIIFLL